MEATFQEVVQNGIDSGTGLTLPEIQGGVDQAYVLFVSGRRESLQLSSVSGGGLTWTVHVDQCGGRGQTSIGMATAFGSPSAFQAVVTVLNPEAKPFEISLLRYADADPVAPFGAAVSQNSVGPGGICSGGSDNDLPLLTTPTAEAESVIVVGVNTRLKNYVTPPSNHIQRSFGEQGVSGDRVTLYTFDRGPFGPGDDVLDSQLDGSADWCTAGIPVFPVGAGGPPPGPVSTTFENPLLELEIESELPVNIFENDVGLELVSLLLFLRENTKISDMVAEKIGDVISTTVTHWTGISVVESFITAGGIDIGWPPFEADGWTDKEYTIFTEVRLKMISALLPFNPTLVVVTLL